MHRKRITKNVCPSYKRITFSKYRKSTTLIQRKISETSKKEPTTTTTTSASSRSELQPGLGDDANHLLEYNNNNNNKDHTRSKHYFKKKRLFEAWEGLRHQLVETRIEEFSPQTYTCSICKADEIEDVIKCSACGPQAYFCARCCHDHHQCILFHSPEIWNGNAFLPFKLSQQELTRTDHTCNSGYRVNILTVGIGVQKYIHVKVCSCEDPAVTLLRHNLWPATPTLPKVAFSLKFMELCAVLQLECQTSTKSIAAAFRELKNFRMAPNLEKDMYRYLVGDCLLEYMYHRSTLKTRHSLSTETIFQICLVCKTDPSYVSLDGNFGLVRKSSSGNSQDLEPRHKGPFFKLNLQKKFNDFIKEDKFDTKDSNNCSDFKAGNALRSKSVNSKLDITGLFGSVCKHNVPLLFLNMNRGESLSYSTFLVKELTSNNIDNNRTVISYDIACLLDKHLKKNCPELLTKIDLTVPVFHSFAHNLPCQVNFGQRYVTSTGLVDGEGIERFWSYLRPSKKITKEMTNVNRQDFLSESMLHFTERITKNLGLNLKVKLQEAQKINLESTTELDLILKSQNIDYSTIEVWLDMLRKQVKSSKTDSGKRETLVKKMHHLAVERNYLKIMMMRYADGQNVWKRISKRLSSNTSLMKKSIKQFGDDLSFKDAQDLSSTLYDVLDKKFNVSNQQRHIIELYMLTQRSAVEVKNIKIEMTTLLQNLSSQISQMQVECHTESDASRFVKGKSHYFHYHILHLEKLHEVWNLDSDSPFPLSVSAMLHNDNDNDDNYDDNDNEDDDNEDNDNEDDDNEDDDNEDDDDEDDDNEDNDNEDNDNEDNDNEDNDNEDNDNEDDDNEDNDDEDDDDEDDDNEDNDNEDNDNEDNDNEDDDNEDDDNEDDDDEDDDNEDNDNEDNDNEDNDNEDNDNEDDDNEDDDNEDDDNEDNDNEDNDNEDNDNEDDDNEDDDNEDDDNEDNDNEDNDNEDNDNDKYNDKYNDNEDND